MVATAEQMNSWYERLTPLSDDLAEITRSALPALTAGHRDLVGVSLLSDADGGTLAPAALTATHRDALVTADPDLAVDYPWLVDEWDLQPRSEDDPFAPVMRRVGAVAATVADEDWVEWVDLVWNWVVEVMQGLVEDGWFEATYPGANVVFHVTDEDIPAETLVEWAELLNPPARTQAYAARLLEG